MFSHRVILRLLCLFKMTFKVYTIINTCKRILWKLSDHTRNQILLLVRTQFPKGLGKNEGLGNDLCQSKKGNGLFWVRIHNSDIQRNRVMFLISFKKSLCKVIYFSCHLDCSSLFSHFFLVFNYIKLWQDGKEFTTGPWFSSKCPEIPGSSTKIPLWRQIIYNCWVSHLKSIFFIIFKKLWAKKYNFERELISRLYWATVTEKEIIYKICLQRWNNSCYTISFSSISPQPTLRLEISQKRVFISF